jgi:hypothetical protein
MKIASRGKIVEIGHRAGNLLKAGLAQFQVGHGGQKLPGVGMEGVVKN